MTAGGESWAMWCSNWIRVKWVCLVPVTLSPGLLWVRVPWIIVYYPVSSSTPSLTFGFQDYPNIAMCMCPDFMPRPGPLTGLTSKLVSTKHNRNSEIVCIAWLSSDSVSDWFFYILNCRKPGRWVYCLGQSYSGTWQLCPLPPPSAFYTGSSVELHLVPWVLYHNESTCYAHYNWEQFARPICVSEDDLSKCEYRKKPNLTWDCRCRAQYLGTAQDLES